MQGERVVALREFARLSRLKFDKGVAGYLEVLIAENELFAAELASVRLLAERYTQLVGVYQAMGGGWVDIADVDRAEAARHGGGDSHDRTHRRTTACAARDADLRIRERGAGRVEPKAARAGSRR